MIPVAAELLWMIMVMTSPIPMAPRSARDGHMTARRRRAVERAEEGQERGKLADQLEFGAHNAHAEEKEPEPEDGFSPAGADISM